MPAAATRRSSARCRATPARGPTSDTRVTWRIRWGGAEGTDGEMRRELYEFAERSADMPRA
jgi:hypothetical protein